MSLQMLRVVVVDMRRVFLSVLKMCARVFHDLILIPAGVLLLVVMLAFWLSGTTPGTVIVREMTAATDNAAQGHFRIRENANVMTDLLYPEPPVAADYTYATATEYADYLDQTWRPGLPGLWVALGAFSVMVNILKRAYLSRRVVKPSEDEPS